MTTARGSPCSRTQACNSKKSLMRANWDGSAIHSRSSMKCAQFTALVCPGSRTVARCIRRRHHTWLAIGTASWTSRTDPTAAPNPRAIRLAPRPARLDGLRLVLVENTKFNAEPLLRKLADRLGAKYGTRVSLVHRKR